MQSLLKFGRANDKLKKLEKRLEKRLYTISLKAGYSCPGASLCFARYDARAKEVIDGKKARFRCFAASLEAVFKGFEANNQHNFDLMRAAKTEDAMFEIMRASIASLKNPGIIRVHVSGDYFNAAYFKAWMRAAAEFPHINFYSYTKSIHILNECVDLIPANFSITCSEGGKFDSLISDRFKTAKVVFSVEAAAVLGMEIDHDDYHAAVGKENFALLLHGSQRGGTEASRAWAINKKLKFA
jgi:Gene product 88